MPVAALLDHLTGLTPAFTWAARKAAPEGGASGPGQARAENLAPRWRILLPRRLDELVAAWRDPDTWKGMADAGGVRMPAEQMGVVVLDELVMHGWDLARAIRRPFSCDPVSTAAVLEFTSAAARSGAPREGIFGQVVEVSEAAPAFDRALGFAGRDPAWTADAR